MELYSRTGVFIGPMPELMTWATGITKHASDLIGSEIACWSAGFGAPAGSMGWSLPVDGLAGVAANNEKMIGDAKYHELLAEGRQYSQPGSVEDAMLQLVHGELTDQRPPIGAVATVTTAVMKAPWAEVIQWGSEMAQLVAEITGSVQMFGTSMFGQFQGVSWIGISPDAAAADAERAKLVASEEYIRRVGNANDLFVEASGNRTFMTRVA